MINFDRSGFQRDPKVDFPIERLEELAQTGLIGSVAARHFTVMGSTDPVALREAVAGIAQALHAALSAASRNDTPAAGGDGAVHARTPIRDAGRRRLSVQGDREGLGLLERTDGPVILEHFARDDASGAAVQAMNVHLVVDEG